MTPWNLKVTEGAWVPRLGHHPPRTQAQQVYPTGPSRRLPPTPPRAVPATRCHPEPQARYCLSPPTLAPPTQAEDYEEPGLKTDRREQERQAHPGWACRPGRLLITRGVRHM